MSTATATEQRIKHKLKAISKAVNTPFNALLDTLFLERFLVRIVKSDYADKLIFKGGMCLAQFLTLGRETKDIDFLLTIFGENIDAVEKVIEDIAAIDAGDDFIYSQIKITMLSLEHKKYPGYRITAQGQLGQIKNKVAIDIGVGDIVRPKTLEMALMKHHGPIFEGSIILMAYPPEYIFSEKLEAILYLGELNSRMKDFYDCYRLIKENILDMAVLQEAVQGTLSNRATKFGLIPEPTAPLTVKWKSFIKKNNINNIELMDIITEINSMLENQIAHCVDV